MQQRYWLCWLWQKDRSRSEHKQAAAPRANLWTSGRSFQVDAELAEKGRFHERNHYFTRSAHRALHDPAASQDAQAETTTSRVSITKDLPILRIDHISAKSPLLGVWRSQLLKASTVTVKKIDPVILKPFPLGT
jgi:hypothetical protein